MAGRDRHHDGRHPDPLRPGAPGDPRRDGDVPASSRHHTAAWKKVSPPSVVG
ncbi:MAG: hypothetical protein R2695_03330 [Acidimicrobiales bacterium]